ncbi:VIT1/CCC1 transporter family protein [Amnibacterium sp. CER49]|uniref:VIT1/CCC1 transporter family protein n=1 Tax=Amnibacterium sp. CER49 TaxID=3039161 RepID=UPI00244AB988|nr:VIT1/CCC1 transporter family protein [Amnibacterium sp. CER49]MDH2444749.1 VIT1/CCC1 transporter family protein [Amnibacterium sp. CER49]
MSDTVSEVAPVDEADAAVSQRANWLRAGVLGANDGIVSVAAIVVGVAGATTKGGPILVAGLAALIGGAVSMALGEYVSVGSQRDSQRAARGGRHSAEDASPWLAALASAVSFLCGGVLPLLAVVLLPAAPRIPGTVVVVIVALAITGALGARLGGAHPLRPTIRTVIGGALALALTYAIGLLLGTSGVV